MKMHHLLTLTLVGLAGWAFGETTPPAAPDAKPIDAIVGKEFTISLDANRTTGYGWQLAKPLVETVVKSVANTYQQAAQAAGATPRVGAGGKEVWTFKAVGQGSTLIEFKYVRPWEKDTPPVKTAIYRVVVKNPEAK